MTIPEAEKYYTDEILENFIQTIFSTLTNVNFDKTEHVRMLKKFAEHRDYFIKNLQKDGVKIPDVPAAQFRF